MSFSTDPSPGQRRPKSRRRWRLGGRGNIRQEPMGCSKRRRPGRRERRGICSRGRLEQGARAARIGDKEGRETDGEGRRGHTEEMEAVLRDPAAESVRFAVSAVRPGGQEDTEDQNRDEAGGGLAGPEDYRRNRFVAGLFQIS